MKLKKLTPFNITLMVFAAMGFILGLCARDLFLDFLVGGSLF